MQQQFAVHIELVATTAGQQCKYRLRDTESELHPHFASRADGRGALRQRMTDEGYRYAGGRIDVRFEWKQRQQPVDAAAHFAIAHGAMPTPMGSQNGWYAHPCF
jgi:hypothetical protein